MSRRRVLIKGSSLPVLRIVVRDGDLATVRTDVADTIESARLLLGEAIVALDLRERTAREAGAREIVDAAQASGVRLAAVLIGDASTRDALANVGLPLIEAPLSARDRPGGGAAAARAAIGDSPADAVEPAPEAAHAPAPAPSPDAISEASSDPSDEPTQAASAQETSDALPDGDLAPAYLTRPLRSGQRFYAQGRDVVVTAPTSRGSELIADGSIFAFSPLRGRVLAGASGNTSACIVASHLDAEPVAVAGVSRTFEASDLQALGGAPVSVALSLDADGGERLTLAALDASSHLQPR